MPRTESAPRERTAPLDDQQTPESSAPEEESEGRSFVRKRTASDNKASGPSAGGRGWGAVNNLRSTQGATDWKPPDGDADEDPVIFRFLDPGGEPFFAYDMHWIDEPLKATKKKSFNCIGDGCPLDELGDKPMARILFNLAVYTPGKEPGKGTWKAVVWTASHKMSQVLQKHASNPKLSPLDGEEHYWSLVKVGGRTATPTVAHVKVRDLHDDWAMDPITEDELNKLRKNMADESYVKFPTLKDLEDIADELNNG